MIKKLRTHIAHSQDILNTYKKKIKLATNIKIENKALAKELEQAGEILTLAEYLTISQFGKHGYYAQSKNHGKTDIDGRWGKALAIYCQEKNYTTIIEFGCGTGELGAATARAYQQRTNSTLSWIGIERDLSIHAKIRKTFEHYQAQDALVCVADSIDAISPREGTLILFPYSLDNLAPNLFINTTSHKKTPPDTMLGISVKNGLLSEIVLEKNTLQKKGYSLQNGCYTQNGSTIDLKTWKLEKGQRAYIATDAFTLLSDITKQWQKQTHLLIIDEFKEEPWTFSLGNLGTPRSLYEQNMFVHDRVRYYQESGKHNFYYPLYRYTLQKALHSLGFRSIRTEIEQKQAATLQQKPWIPIKKNYATLAITADQWTPQTATVLPLTFNPKKLL